MEDNGFTLVKKKNSSKRRMGKCNIEKRTTEIFGDKNIKIDKDEVKRRVDTAIVDLSSSDYLSEVLRYVKEVSRVKWDNIYCFGLGHFSESVTAKYQFAFLMSFKESLGILASKTFVSDPIFYKDEELIISETYNLNVITENLECYIPCEEPSIIILPHCPKQLTNNLLFSNWKPCLLENILVISNSMENISGSLRNSHVKFISAVVDYNILKEVKLKNNFKFSDIFNDLSIHTFEVPEHIDQDIWMMPRPVYDEDDVEFIPRQEII